ncbi:MAG: ribonuclease [Rhizobiales bacterium]|nr:ribonuclease [Hyphomicrobiales bacterium]MBI3672870.1 ribonuclease [Hyphomicrobiales bacterium]
MTCALWRRSVVAIACLAGLATMASAEGRQPFYVLALSWEPAFCEGFPDKPECRAETPGGFDATHLSLHGLWPQPRSRELCGVDATLKAADDAHRWQDLPEPELTPATRAALDRVMPGTRSLLERHEWIKHGTCYPGRNADTYFKDAVRLIDAVNVSPVQAFLAANVGKSVTTADLRASFDAAFGAGAGERLRIACKDDGNRRLIAEMTLGLRGDISAGTSVAALVAAAPPTSAGCPGGIVDPVGLQ